MHEHSPDCFFYNCDVMITSLWNTYLWKNYNLTNCKDNNYIDYRRYSSYNEWKPGSIKSILILIIKLEYNN